MHMFFHEQAEYFIMQFSTVISRFDKQEPSWKTWAILCYVS